MTRETWARAWPALVLAGLTLAVFWRVVFAGQGLSSDGSLINEWRPWADTELAAEAPRGNVLLRDQYAFFNANEEYISRWVRRGVWPLWNPDLAHGIPTVASIQNAEYYPTNLLFWPFPPFWTRGIRAMLRVGLCLLGTYCFARAVGCGRPGATLAAMGFAFCGFNVVWLSHPPTNVSFLLPCILWTLERTLQTGGFGWGAGLALFAGGALLGGHPPTVLHITVPVLIWLAFRLFVSTRDPAPRLRLRSIGWRLALCAIAAALIASASLLPWTEYLPQNPGTKAPLRVLRTLSWETLAAWVVPDFFGNPLDSQDWAARLYRVPGWNNYAERTGFVGVAGLLLAGSTLLWRRLWRPALPWAAGLAASLVLIYGTPVVGALARSLPGFRIVNNSKMLSVACFCVAMLAAQGCDRLMQARERFGRALAGWALSCLAGGLLVFAVWPDAAGRAWIDEIGARGRFLGDCLWAAVPALAVLGSILLVRFSRERWALALLILVSAIDLWRFGTGFNPAIERRHAAPPTAGIEYLQTRPTARVLPVGRQLLPGNTSLRYGLADARGGDWVNVRHYEYLLTGKTGHYDFGANLKAVPETLHALNVSHLLFSKGTRLPPQAALVYDDELRIVPFAGGLPRALLVHDARFVQDDAEARELIAGGKADLRRTVLLQREDRALVDPIPDRGELRDEPVRVTHASPNQVRLSVEARARGFLVLVDTFFPGWECRLDGAVVPILRANVAFRSVEVPPGAHELVFRYRPWRARLGLAVSALTFLAIPLLALGRFARRRGGRSFGRAEGR